MTMKETFPTMMDGWTNGPYRWFANQPIIKIRVESHQIVVMFSLLVNGHTEP